MSITKNKKNKTKQKTKTKTACIKKKRAYLFFFPKKTSKSFFIAKS